MSYRGPVQLIIAPTSRTCPVDKVALISAPDVEAPASAAR
ncbi:Uncharacterised protein [Mycobacteroides abscessus subsp. abscessus]|nr:Uncharacterised protein [Mycobacteroides abscessus subsp. abscessus]